MEVPLYNPFKVLESLKKEKPKTVGAGRKGARKEAPYGKART